jgi:hypothetical protein
MSRYLITVKNGCDEVPFIDDFGEFTAAFWDSPDPDGPEPGADAVVARYDERRIRSAFRHHDFPPEYAYHLTDRADPRADYVVYRETPDGDLLCVGAVRCDLVHPAIGDAQSLMCPACGVHTSEGEVGS